MKFNINNNIFPTPNQTLAHTTNNTTLYSILSITNNASQQQEIQTTSSNYNLNIALTQVNQVGNFNHQLNNEFNEINNTPYTLPTNHNTYTPPHQQIIHIANNINQNNIQNNQVDLYLTQGNQQNMINQQPNNINDEISYSPILSPIQQNTATSLRQQLSFILNQNNNENDQTNDNLIINEIDSSAQSENLNNQEVSFINYSPILSPNEPTPTNGIQTIQLVSNNHLNTIQIYNPLNIIVPRTPTRVSLKTFDIFFKTVNCCI